jgi:hypothetical protein
MMSYNVDRLLFWAVATQCFGTARSVTGTSKRKYLTGVAGESILRNLGTD